MTRVVEPEQLEDNLEYKDFYEPEGTPDTSTQEQGTSSEALDALEDNIQSDIPDKFKDKTLKDVIDSYTALEKEFGRKNNEVGELRKLTDDILKQQLEKPTQEKENHAIDLDELLDNPEGTVSKVVDPKIQALEEQLKVLQSEPAKRAFEEKHPDWQEKMGTPEFEQWITASPVRQQMFIEANNNYDYTLGSDLLDQYDALRGVATENAKQERTRKRDEALKDTTVEKGSTGESPKQYYRRADLARLYQTDRDRYNSMQDEIMLAYAEGRVK